MFWGMLKFSCHTKLHDSRVRECRVFVPSSEVSREVTTVSDDGAADRSWSRHSALTAVETSDGVFVRQRVVISGCQIQTICRVSSSETQGLTKTAISAEQRRFLSVDFLTHTCT